MNNINNSNINNSNIIVTPDEYKSQILIARVEKYIENKPFIATMISTPVVIGACLLKVTKVSYFAGVKVSQCLIAGPKFIIGKFANVACSIYQKCYQQPEEYQTITKYEITNTGPVKKYFDYLTNLAGYGTSFGTFYLLYKGAYEFCIPVSTSVLGLSILFYLDFLRYGFKKSISMSTIEYILSYLKQSKNADYQAIMKLNSLAEIINYFYSLTNIENSSVKATEFNIMLADLTDAEKKQIFNFLQKLVATKEFQISSTSRKIFAQRIMNIFLAVFPKIELRTQAMLRFSDSLDGCHDHILLVLSELETAIFVNLIENPVSEITKEGIIASAEKVFYLEKIRAFSILLSIQQKYAPEGNYVEIENIFHIVLGSKYNLPISIQHLSSDAKKITALVTENDINNLEEFLNKAFIEEFPRYLENWQPWKKFQRKLEVISYDQLEVISYNQLEIMTINKNEAKCLFSQECTDDLVYLNNNTYSYASLKKWYIDNNGTDPVSLTIMQWHDVYRV